MGVSGSFLLDLDQPGSPGQRDVKWLCVCVSVCVWYDKLSTTSMTCSSGISPGWAVTPKRKKKTSTNTKAGLLQAYCRLNAPPELCSTTNVNNVKLITANTKHNRKLTITGNCAEQWQQVSFKLHSQPVISPFPLWNSNAKKALTNSCTTNYTTTSL